MIGTLALDNLTRMIAEHRPDSLLPTLGGQTGLNLAVALDDAGVLDPMAFACSGRRSRRSARRRIEEDSGARHGHWRPVPESAVIESLEDGVAFAAFLAARRGSPCFHAGRRGRRLRLHAGRGARAHRARPRGQPHRQVLVERGPLGWKEIEFEVLREATDTTIAICGMENMDPMSVRAGDSIVVAPIQTLPRPADPIPAPMRARERT